MTASVVRLRRSAFSYLLGFGLLVAASFLAFGAVPAPAWGQSNETPAAGPSGGAVPGNVQGNRPARAFWRAGPQREGGKVTTQARTTARTGRGRQNVDIWAVAGP